MMIELEKSVFMTFKRSCSRPAALVAVVLALLLVTGCSEDHAGDAKSGQPGQADDSSGQYDALEEITLSVPGMDCPMCPVTVRRALNRVEGVIDAKADLSAGEARVRFDPALTDVDQLVAAVEDAGFSATPKENRHE